MIRMDRYAYDQYVSMLAQCAVTAVLVRCHRAAIIDGPDTSPGQSCLTAAPCNMDMWTAGHYLN